MSDKGKNMTLKNNQSGVTLVELMVALAVGSFLMIGAVQVYNQSRQAFVINESIDGAGGEQGKELIAMLRAAVERVTAD